MKFVKVQGKEGTMYFNLEHVSIIDATPSKVKIWFSHTRDSVELIENDAAQFMKQCEDIERREIIHEN